MSRDWAKSKVNASGQLIEILAHYGYAVLDKNTGTMVLRITRLQKEQSIQSVSRWFKVWRPSTIDLMLSEIRDLLEANGCRPLRDEGTSKFDFERSQGYQKFGR